MIHNAYWREIDQLEKVSLLDQVKAIHKAYFSVKEETIKEYFYRCGILDTTPPHQILERLFFEGVYPVPKFRSFHENQLSAFIEWNWNGKENIESIFGIRFQNLFPQKR